MFKKILTFFMALLVAMQPLVAAATDLDSAFGNLLGPGTAVSVNQPGHYQSGARNSFVAGGLEMRVPHQAGSPQLFSVTPPNITAGCNGISATFGGFSYISGAEFEQMLKSIASGAALGFVSMMVLKVMCPPCEAVVQFLKTAAQQAARLAKDACKWGQDMAREFDKAQTDEGPTREVCGTTLSANGTTSDFLDAVGVKDPCNSLTGAVNALLGENTDAMKTPDGKAQVLCEIGGVGNITWQRLKAFDASGSDVNNTNSDGYKRKVLLMNLMGAEIGKDTSAPQAGCHPGLDGTGDKLPDDKPAYCEPKLSPDQAMALFLCGAPDAGASKSPSPRVVQYCNSFYKGSGDGSTPATLMTDLTGLQVWTCLDSTVHCEVLQLSNASSALASGTGFLVNVNQLLHAGVTAVRMNQPMPKDVLRLMQVAPFPLYQAINAAAVYPAAADDLIDSMSILVAEQAAVAYLDDMLRLPGATSDGKKSCLSAPQAEKILEVVSKMRAVNRARTAEIGQNISIQEALTEQIRQINQTIQKEVMTQDMVASGHYAQAINKALANPAAPNPLEALPQVNAAPAN